MSGNPNHSIRCGGMAYLYSSPLLCAARKGSRLSAVAEDRRPSEPRAKYATSLCHLTVWENSLRGTCGGFAYATSLRHLTRVEWLLAHRSIRHDTH